MRCWSSSPGSYTLHCKSRHFNLRLKQRNGCDTWRGPHCDVLNCLHVRVEHPQCIAVPSSKALWKLFKAATPQHAWEDVAVSLACLESLYRVEFSQAAEECIAAFNAANSAPVPVDAETKSEQQQQQQQHDEQAGDEVAAAASAAVKAVTTAVAVAANAGESPPEPQQQPSEEQLMQAAAEQADRVLAAHIKYLADRSHFQAFTRRDCELGKTLNQGYQGQLFIQSNDRKLDKSLLRAFTANTGPSSGEGAQQSAVPERGPGQQVVQSFGSDSVGEQQGSIVGQESDQQVALGESFSVDPSGSQQRGVRIHWSDPWRVQEDDCVESMDVQQRSAPGGDPGQHTAQDDTSEDDVDAQQNGMPARGSDQCVRHGNHDKNPVNAQQDDHNRDPVYAQQDNQNRDPVNSRQDNLNRNTINTLRDNHRPDQHALLEESRSAVLSACGAHLSSLRGRGPDQWGLSAHFHSVPGCGPNQGGVSGAHSNSLPGCGPDDWIMHDTGVVVMKRGFSRETATGMLLLPKLDYLQTAVVEEALLRIRSLLRAGWQGLLHRSQRSLADASDTLAKENTEQEMGPTSLLERATRAGERAIAWLSVRGAAPIVDSMTVQDIDKAFPVVEPPRLSPLLLKVVGLREILGAKSIFQQAPNDIAQLLVQPLELEEPSLQEIAVLYRRVQRPEQTGFLGRMKGLASAIWKRGTRRSPPAPKTTILRPPISLQIYRDIPLPTWSVVLPEKVLQFRPLDFLRTDLFAAAGLVAALAQARYESFYLDVVTAVSASIFLIRIFLGFRRQVDRYRVRLAEILREKTVACDATAIQYMAASAADQQFAQAALCYVLLLQHQNDTAHQDCTAHQRQDNTQQRQDGAAYQCQDDIHQHQDSKAYQKDTACQRQEDIAHQDSTAPPRHGDFQQHQDSTAHQKDAVRQHHYNIHWHQHSTAHREDTAQGSKSRQGCTGIGLEVLASRAEQLLADHAGLRVCVNVDQAMSELLQRGLARRVPPMSPSNGELPLDDGQSHAGEDAQHSFHETGGKLGQEGRGTQHSVPKIEGGSRQRKTEGQCFQAVDPCVAQQVLEQQWDSILWQRVHSTLGRVEALSGSEPLGRS